MGFLMDRSVLWVLVTVRLYYFRLGQSIDRVAQLAEHWASIPKVVGSIPTAAGHFFQARPVWIYTQSNITNILCKCSSP